MEYTHEVGRYLDVYYFQQDPQPPLEEFGKSVYAAWSEVWPNPLDLKKVRKHAGSDHEQAARILEEMLITDAATETAVYQQNVRNRLELPVFTLPESVQAGRIKWDSAMVIIAEHGQWVRWANKDYMKDLEALKKADIARKEGHMRAWAQAVTEPGLAVLAALDNLKNITGRMDMAYEKALEEFLGKKYHDLLSVKMQLPPSTDDYTDDQDHPTQPGTPESKDPYDDSVEAAFLEDPATIAVYDQTMAQYNQSMATEDPYDDPEEATFLEDPATIAVYDQTMAKYNRANGSDDTAMRPASSSVPPHGSSTDILPPTSPLGRTSYSLPPITVAPDSPSKRRIIPTEKAPRSVLTVAAQRDSNNVQLHPVPAQNSDGQQDNDRLQPSGVFPHQGQPLPNPQQIPQDLHHWLSLYGVSLPQTSPANDPGPSHQAMESPQFIPAASNSTTFTPPAVTASAVTPPAPISVDSAASAPPPEDASDTRMDVDDGPRQRGRPTNIQVDALYVQYKEMDLAVRRCADAAGLPPPSFMEKYNKRSVLKKQENVWNDYQSYASHPDNILAEASRLLGIAERQHEYAAFTADPTKKLSKDQLGATWKAFQAEHGDEAAKEHLASWVSIHDTDEVVSQRKVDRRRTFDIITRQIDDFLEMCYNIYDFNFWLIGSGEAGFLKSKDRLGAFYRAHTGHKKIEAFTKQELIAMAEAHGLVVAEGAQTRPEPVIPTTIPTGPVHSTVKKPSKTDLANQAKDAMVVAALKIDVDFKRKLWWTAIATQCLEKGFSIVNYPRGVTLPWKTQDGGRRKGIQSHSMDELLKLTESCAESSPNPLTFERADSIKLRNNDIPVLARAPDEKGNVETFFYKDTLGPGHLPPPSSSEGTICMVKTECQDRILDDASCDSDGAGDATPTATPSQSFRRSTRPTSKVSLNLNLEEDEDEDEDVDQIRDNDDDDYYEDGPDGYTTSPSKIQRKSTKGKTASRPTAPSYSTQLKGKGKALVLDVTPRPTNSTKRKDSPVAVAPPNDAAKRMKTSAKSTGWATGFTSYPNVNRLREQQPSSASTSIAPADADFQPMELQPPPNPSTTLAGAPKTAQPANSKPSSATAQPLPTTTLQGNIARSAAPIRRTMPSAAPGKNTRAAINVAAAPKDTATNSDRAPVVPRPVGNAASRSYPYPPPNANVAHKTAGTPVAPKPAEQMIPASTHTTTNAAPTRATTNVAPSRATPSLAPTHPTINTASATSSVGAPPPQNNAPPPLQVPMGVPQQFYPIQTGHQQQTQPMQAPPPHSQQNPLAVLQNLSPEGVQSLLAFVSMFPGGLPGGSNGWNGASGGGGAGAS
ncbi:hypothetical protein PM082_023415 [Marasmius tenuissimus]|nr:hypothetical protein PM082_023415 [Marasmius tenuissimus]